MKKILLSVSTLSILLFNGCTPTLPFKMRPSPDVKTLSIEELCAISRPSVDRLIYMSNAKTGSGKTVVTKGYPQYYEVEKASPEQLRILEQETVDAKAELKRRNPFTKNEWKLIKDKKVQVGMSRNALLCSWGTPRRMHRSSYGPDQYVYNGGYVYLRGNRVSNWSN